MAENTRRVSQALVSAYDFSRFRKIIDVGGGNGALMTAIVATNPDIRGCRFHSRRRRAI